MTRHDPTATPTFPGTDMPLAGTIAGVLPYDFSAPTPGKIRSRLWDPHSERVIGPHLFGIGCHHDTRANKLKRFLDRAYIAAAVIDHGNRRPGAFDAHFDSVPLVDGTPDRRGSPSTAMRKARASALNKASIP